MFHKEGYQSIFITILAWEGNLRIDTWMNTKFPWVLKPGKRLLVHFPTSMIFTSVAIYLPMVLFHIYVCNMPASGDDRAFMLTTIVIGILIYMFVLGAPSHFDAEGHPINGNFFLAKTSDGGES